MAIRISVMVLRICALAALILGILFWTDNAKGLTLLHILLGFAVVISLWVLGIAQGLRGGSFGLALATFVVGLLLAFVGLFQTRWLTNDMHWIIQVIHLVLALAAIGLGEMISATTRKRLKGTQTA